MSFLGKLFGNDSSNANNEQVICWTVDILNIIEKAGPALSINSCGVQVIAGNNVPIQIQDWYDDFIPRFGAEYGLDNFFELVPASGTSDIYVSKITPHISGSSKRFINDLEQTLKIKTINGYQKDKRLDCIQKNFHD